MDFFFHPKSVAVVGATPNKAKGGYAILKNLQNTFRGEIYPVNPRYTSIENLTCYPTVADVPGQPDLAILFISADQILETVEACIEKGIPGVIIQSGGFSETGCEGETIQNRLSALAGKTGIRIWGPNCMGLVDAKDRAVFSFTDPEVLGSLLKPGPVSLVVQSGMLSAGFVVDLLSHEITGFNKICSIGNKADVNECDLLEYLLSDPDTGVIGFYLESFVDLRHFIDIYDRHGRAKPVVVLKGGKSETGRQAALSHTASLAGNYHLISDVLKQAGIFLARDFHQMIDLCRTLAMVRPRQAPLSAPGVAILTFSGASGIVATDFMSDLGLKIAALQTETRSRLQTFFPAWMPPANPVDVWPAMEQHSGKSLDIYALALDAVLEDPGVEACMIHTFAGFSRVRLNLEETARLARKWGKPVFIWILGERERVLAFQVEARDLDLPVYHELYRGVECMAAALCQPTRPVSACTDNKTAEPPAPSIIFSVPPIRGILDEHEAKALLHAADLPTVEEYLCNNVEECQKQALVMGFPVVLKGLEKDRVHKSEAGFVKTDIADESQLMEAYTDLKNRLSPDGMILLQRQIRGQLELILGYLRDPQCGPCVMVGLGGLFAETLNDTVFSLAPVDEQQALALIERLKNRNLLHGARGIPSAPVKAIARYLVLLGELGRTFPSLQDIDINPLILSDSGPVIVDATIILN